MDIKEIVVYWKEFKIPETNRRQIPVDINTDLIRTITGPRRAGKTYLCFQLIHELRERGISDNNILYINFEDERLLNFSVQDLDTLFKVYTETYTLNPQQKIFLFFDEIHNIDNWDAWIRRIVDSKPEVRFVLTGSSSKLLSREISTKLRGRTINIEMFPLSFTEYLNWEKIEYNLKTIEYSGQNQKVKAAFTRYLHSGGFPRVAAEGAPDKLLQTYYEVMLLRDIAERYNIRNIHQLKTVAQLLFDSVASEFSYTKIKNRLNSLGFNISKNTIIEYINHFEEAYLFFQNLKYEYSTHKQLGAIKKIYCVDNGLLNANSFKFSDNEGKLLENLVYLELKRRGKTVFYFRDIHECDFLIKEKDKLTIAIQVTDKLTETNRDRELDGLWECAEKYGIQKGFLLTNGSYIQDINDLRMQIRILPVWYFLLSDLL